MRARADAAEQTAERVMDAAIALWRAGPFEDITLQEIADRAGTSLSTVMRRFGSKDGLAEAVLRSDRVGTQAGRDAVADGDLPGAVRMIVADYELNGDAVIRMLALEERVPAVAGLLQAGRAGHRAWVQEAFADRLPAAGPERDQAVALHVAATDPYVWKLLRRDMAMSREDTIEAMRRLVDGLKPPTEK